MIYRKSLQSTAAVGEWYDSKYKDMDGCWKTPVEELDQHLDDFGLTGGNLSALDIGCGDGSFVRRMRERGYEAFGIEVSEEAIERGDGQYVWKQDICDKPTTPDYLPQYDRIISLGSLEHVIDIDAALDNIRLSLTPDGRWYFYIPNELWKHQDQPNERTATDAEWTVLFRRHGLIVESSKRWNDSTAFHGSVYKRLKVEISSVICGGDGPKLAFNFNGLRDDFGIDTETERVCFVDPSIGSGVGNIKCRWYDNRTNLITPCRAYQALLDATEADVLVYVHDDVQIYDPNWLTRVMDVFESNPKCVAVGLGGATSLGRPNLYKRPYQIWNMARNGYASNQRDAETHGERFTGDRQVAVLDAFFQAVRVDWLRSIGGWPVKHLTHHGADLWLGCMAARTEKEIHMCGIDASHWGGGTSTDPRYRESKWLQGGSMEEDHRRPHFFLFSEFRDVLPFSV